MTLRQIKDILEADILAGADHLARDVKVAFACDLMSDVLAFAPTGSLLLTGLTNLQVVRTVEMAELVGICFARGKEPEKETVLLAKKKGLPLLRTRLSMFETCGRLAARGLVGVGPARNGLARQVECGSGNVGPAGGTEPVAKGDQ